ncbi:MAG: zinc ribbon domain-containing protein [Anaerolineae bacterium]|nr:zinc ribbon domain-containing protein [Anaerolineae bacterium]
MPLYEYVCPECEITFDTLRGMSQADAPIACPECTSLRPYRIISLFAAVSHDTAGTGRMVAGGNGGCGSCSSHACSSCSHAH